MNFIKKALKRAWVLSLLSVLLLSLPWLGGGGFWILFAWVPLLLLRDNLCRDGQRGFLAWVAITLALWIIVTCFWVSFATMIAAAAVPIAGVVSLWPAWAAFHFVAKKNKKALAYTVLVCAYVVCEWWYSMGDVSFPWLTLGGAFAEQPFAVQWYSALGIYGGSAWIMVANLLIYTALTKRKVAYWAVGWVVVPLAISITQYFNYDTPTQTVEVGIIQPNVDAYEKFSEIGSYAQTTTLIELAASAPRSTQLYVAPETAITETVDQRAIDQCLSIGRIQDFLRTHSPHATFIVGASTYNAPNFHNSALCIDTATVRIYNKSKLVLGVEIMPQWLNPILHAIDLGGYVGSLGRQDERTVFDTEWVAVGGAVCYESIYGDYFSDWVRGGAQLMTIITNDGWWGDTPGYKQHFSYASLRAIENRRSIARSANTGISAAIDPRGNVMERLGWNEKGIITAELPLNESLTPYVRWGDIVVRLSIYVLALSLLYAVAMYFGRKV